MNRIKSLDGIRGIFIIMVLIAHTLETTKAFTSNHQNLVFFITNLGHIGVRIFFVMSGYLITKLLLREREKTGKISIKDFYIRRTFRILPTFMLYILVILALKWSILPDIFTSYSLVFFAFFYLWNYKHLFISDFEHDKGSWFLGHFWSLSMEEQFYLLWPVTFIKFKKETLIKLLLVIIAIMPILRCLTFLFLPGSRPHVQAMLHTGGDAIMIGCLTALIEQSVRFKKIWARYADQHLLMVGLIVFLFFISPALTLYLKAAYVLTLGISLSNVAIMILLYWAMYTPSRVSDFLNLKIVAQLGVASYSIYVWQQLFLTDKNEVWVNKFPQNIFVALAVGLACHYWFEKPILKLKDRFKKI